jgi:hypothetical protein
MASKSQKKEENTPVYEKSGPGLLAMQPSETDENTDTGNSKEDWSFWPTLRSHLESNLIALRLWRQSWWTENWSDLARYILPRRSIWLTQSTGGLPTPNNMTRGREINTNIVDPTATYDVRICAGGLMSGLASPSRPWFKIVPAMRGIELDAAARQWIDSIEEIIYTVLARSNFYNSFAQECEDLTVFGTAPVIIYEDDKDLIRLYNPAVGEYYLSADATMRVDGLYRAFVMTVQQMVGFFGLKNLPQDIQALWKKGGSSLQTERIVAHAIEPNFEVDSVEGTKIEGAFTWRETYWVYGQGNEKPCSLRGFVDQAFTAARWATQSNDAYGRSPGMDVLPDVIQLQVETRRKAEGIEKHVRPPLVADMSMKNQPSSALPGHVTYVNNLGPNSGMRPMYEVQPDLQYITADIAQVQARIGRGLFTDLFMLLSQNPGDRRTAYEAAQMVQERMQVVGPVIENIIGESLQPKLKRIFAILKRRGFIPEPPKSLHGTPLDITFISMLALAQKAASTGGLEAIIKLIGEASAVFPSMKDNLDPDAFIREYNDLLGNKEKILLGPEKVAQSRQAQQQAQQKAQQQMDISHAAETANTGAQAAQALGATPIGSGHTALSALLGNQAGGA